MSTSSDIARLMRAQHQEKTYTCAVCGTTFKTTGHNARLCSPRCRRRARLLRKNPNAPQRRRAPRTDSPPEKTTDV